MTQRSSSAITTPSSAATRDCKNPGEFFKAVMRAQTFMTIGAGSSPDDPASRILSRSSHTPSTIGRQPEGISPSWPRFPQMLFRLEAGNSSMAEYSSPAETFSSTKACRTWDFCLTTLRNLRMRSRQRTSPVVMSSTTATLHMSRARRPLRRALRLDWSLARMPLTTMENSFNRASHMCEPTSGAVAASPIQMLSQSAPALAPSARQTAGCCPTRLVTQRHSSANKEAIP
mmetsp:Transcript_58345/g.169301  ORF Transcript_58345/g.169301 Transcript_58345/m.169301 type:complete len:230 (-) Transcript_58345:7-696(-)